MGKASSLQCIEPTPLAAPPGILATAFLAFPAAAAAATCPTRQDDSSDQDFLRELLGCSKEALAVVGNAIAELGEGQPTSPGGLGGSSE